VATGGYERIAAKLFQQLNYDLFYLEYDSERAGDLAPLQHLPKDKAVVLGLVSTKDAKLEDPGELKTKVLKAADMIAKGQGVAPEEALRNNIAISPQCGFSSQSAGGGVDVTEDVQWEKIALLQRLADDVWRSR
jgi:methionine synthase II (cobalamin-independent)